MKKIVQLLLLFNITSHSFAQTEAPVSIVSTEIGLDYRTNTPIVAREYTFPLPVFRLHANSVQADLTVQLRQMNADGKYWKNPGKIMSIDPETGLIKWSQKFKYQTNRLIQDGNVTLHQSGNKLTKLNGDNGSVLWKSKFRIYSLYPDLNLALGYDYPKSGLKTLYGIDLRTGKHRWSRAISSETGFEKPYFLNDSTMLIHAGGLHTLDIYDGQGWSMNRITAAKHTDMKKVGLSVLGGIAGAMGGVMMIPGDLSDLYLNISSNVLRDGGDIYYASKNKISRQGLAGERRWDRDLDQKLTSKSQLFKEGNTIYMINMGYAIKYNIPSRFGTPFVSAFDATTGEELFSKVWDSRKDFIRDYLIQGSDLYLLYQNKIEVHSFSNRDLALKKSTILDSKTDMVQFVSDQLFFQKDSSFIRFSSDTTNYYLISEDREILKLDNELNLIGKVGKEEIYNNYLETPGFLFLGKNGNTVVIDKNKAQPVARFKAAERIARFGNRLFTADKRLVTEIDISEFTGQ